MSGTPKTESEAKAAVIRENAEAITDDEVNELADSDLAAAVRRAKSIAERGERSTISTTAGKVLGRIQFSPRMPAAARVLMGDTMRRMRKLVSDVPLHVQDEATFYEDYARKKAANNEPIHVLPRAYYDPNTDEIFVRQDRQDDPGDLLHEMTHAAYDRVLDLNPEVRADIRQLMKAVDAQLDKEAGERGEFHYNIPYGLTNEHEFLTEAWTNPDFQKTLARTQLTPEVSKSFGMPAGISAWHALLRSIRQYLFPNGGQAQITALEAIIRKTAEIDAVATRYQQAAQQGQVIREAAAGSRTARVADRLSDERAATPGRFRKLMKLATAHQLEQLYDRHFTGLNGPIERLNRARDALRKTAQDSIQDGNVHAERFLKMQSADPEEAAKTARLANRITKANVNMVNDATAGMPELLAANPHLGGPKSDRMNNFQSRAELPVLHREFMALKPESRQWMMDAADYFRKTQNRNTKAVVGKLLSAIRGDLTVQQLADLQQHTITGKLTEEDRELLGNDDLYNGLVRAQEFRLVDGMYFPLMRHGDHVVTTRSKIGDLHGGVVDGDIIEFTGVKDSVVRKMAKAFLAAQATRGAEKIEATGFGIKRRLLDGTEVSEIDARGHPHTISYRFRLQTQGTYFFESARLAEAFRREHIDAGTFDQISQVRPRKQLHEADQLTSGAMRGILSALDKRTDIDKGDAAYLKGLLQEASVRQLAGNRFQQRALPRRNVRGESENMARNIADYVTASSHAYARTRHMDGIRGILKEMEDFNSTRGMAADAPQREAVVQELVKRSEQSYQDHAGQPDWVRNAMVLSYLYRLFSPAHSIINGTQPWAVTMPILAGRHGVVRTVAALTRAYNTVGGAGIIGSGLYNTAKAGGGLGKISIDTTDIIGSSRKLIGQADDGTFLLKAVDNAIANGKIEDNAGQEVVSAVGAGKGAFGRSLARVDRAARQMPISVEALNRLSTVVAAARLAKSDGMTDEQAIKYSFDMLMQTQGDYSLQNNPAFFSHPIASIGLQFKKYSLMMGNLLADTIRRSFKGATPQERRIAQKQFMGILGVQMAVAGAFSLPGLELLKVGFMISAALGLTDGWDDQERKLRRIFDNAFGKGWGEKLTKGVLSRSMGPLSVDLSQRMSLSDLLFFGEPKDYDNDGIMAYLARLAFGAPAGMVLDWRQGIEMAGDGDYDKAIAKMLPIAFLSNIAKAVRGRVNRDITDTEAVMQAVGFRSGRMAEQGEKIGADIAQSKKLDKEASLLKRQYIEAGPRGLAAIRQRIDEHNRAVEEIQKARAAERVDGKPSNKGKVYTKGLDAIRKDKDAKRAVLQGD